MSKVKPLTLEPEIASNIQEQEFNLKIATAAEEVIFKLFPEKILALQNLIDDMSTPSSDYNPANPSATPDVTVYPSPYPSPLPSTEPPAKKRKRDTGETLNGESQTTTLPGSSGSVYPQLVHANEHIRSVQLRNRKEFEDMISLCDKVKLWINLTMPRIEDGDNFGVQIQEEVLNELSRAQESAYNLRDVARAQHFMRAKLCAKLIKYPNIEDYVIAVRDHDEKQLYMARQHMYDMRNVYAILFDILQKNIQKIRSPKGNNSVGMY